ncbi:LiaF domain-containing protein [Saccharothrix longispora]|uniref:LiaF transmembrane domain-containing protein n=1 Tax=Saccharothrix longispora TaxID=33920 RepID=A0ABU1PP25_9PSEU|nr:LiaF domain-containing protein [Saccharothrix longispora]MDR6591834.1 hypothetical protein [Saccharothrix longispora]
MRFWIGTVLVVFGVLGVLDAVGVVDAWETAASWWPVAVIGLGVVGAMAQGHLSPGPGVVVAIGVVLLADTLDLTRGSLLWPALLLFSGGGVLLGLRRHRTNDHRDTGATPVALFGGTKVRERSEHLTRVGVSAIFGGATLDLRDAHVDREADVDAFALFGGIEVLVPRGWRVSLGGLPVFGGYDDNTDDGPVDPDAPLVRVNVTAVFGGVDVRNDPK